MLDRDRYCTDQSMAAHGQVTAGLDEQDRGVRIVGDGRADFLRRQGTLVVAESARLCPFGREAAAVRPYDIATEALGGRKPRVDPAPFRIDRF